jgi:hypothetical protein
MKRIFFLLIAASGALSATAQMSAQTTSSTTTQALPPVQTAVPGHSHLVDPNRPKFAAESCVALKYW